jgi:subtilisin family serine protease
MKFILGSLVFLIVLIFFIPMFVANSDVEKISPGVLEEFSEGNETVKVVIKLKDVSEEELEELIEDVVLDDVEDKDVYKNYVSQEVSLDELSVLEEHVDVEMISESHEIHAFLQEVVGIVNFSFANSLQFSGFNLTGTSKSVCVIDSGVDFTHPDLEGRNLSCVVDCFDKVCIEDCSVGDANGHGTHVAGIVGASGDILGVANNVGLIGVKILDGNGDGSGNSLDLNRAVDYCVSKNVSVITMSLGTSTLYDSDCAGSMGAWTESIDGAFAKNISVIVASGNAGNFTHIASPACIANATPVGDTYDANGGSLTWTGVCTDSSRVVDQIVCHANRNFLVKLFAPGALINSTYNNGGYVVQGGTSMAAPVVAGAYAIIYQLLDLTGRTMNSSSIEEILNNSGKTINDANSSLSFSRIDVYEAVLSLDNIVPNVSLNSPVDGNIGLMQDLNFSCNYSDWQLSNVTFYLWNSSGAYYNESKDVSGFSNSSVFNLSGIPYGDYAWNCLAYDDKSNFAFFDSNFSFGISEVITVLDSPENNSYVSQAVDFSCNLTSNESYELSNATFYLWNSSGLYYNESKDVSGLSNSSVFNYSFSIAEAYTWNCLGFNNNSESDWADENFSITSDFSVMNISLKSPSSGVSYNSNSKSVVFYYNVSEDNEIANCSLIVNGGVSSTNLTINKSSVNLTFVQSFVPGSYNWNINCSDDAGNVGNSSVRSFSVVGVSAPVVSASGSSGGGGTSSKIYVLNETQSSQGYTKKLNKNDKIKFTFFDENSEEHTLTVSKINFDSVEFIIMSEPINLKLGIGQSAKLNLTSPDYYNIYLKLNSIVSNVAEITLQTINEKIIEEENVVGANDFKNESVSEENDLGEGSLIFEITKLRNIIDILVVIIILIIIILIIIILLTRKIKTEKPKVKHKRESFLRHLLEI